MGYTHYWKRPVELDVETFRAAVADCRKVCEALPIPLGDGDGKGVPMFADDAVIFNGHVDSASFSREGGGLCWPTDSAEGVAVAGTGTQAGTWCGGPTVSSRCVDENGDGSYETFAVERKESDPYFAREIHNLDGTVDKPEHPDKCFTFCKTNFRPYDLCVQCCLIVFKEHFGEAFIVTSDGTNEQWQEAGDACQHFLGYGLGFQPGEWKAVIDDAPNRCAES